MGKQKSRVHPSPLLTFLWLLLALVTRSVEFLSSECFSGYRPAVIKFQWLIHTVQQWYLFFSHFSLWEWQYKWSQGKSGIYIHVNMSRTCQFATMWYVIMNYHAVRTDSVWFNTLLLSHRRFESWLALWKYQFGEKRGTIHLERRHKISMLQPLL